MIGTRGVPASYSGFETCVEQLGSRLAARGHSVTIYCRGHHINYKAPTYRGMQLVRLPTIPSKHLDTITHTFISCIHTLVKSYDLVMMFIVGNSSLAWIPRLAGQKVALNVDGLDWRRKKWNRVARTYIRWSERLATFLPNAIITDSHVVQRYYRERYNAESTYIAYGADVIHRPPGSWLAQFGLNPRQYVLFVGRLVPENCPHHLVEAFESLASDFKCVIVGDAPYAKDYIASLKATTDPRIVFTGYLFGEGFEELASNAYIFVETSEVGGTHPVVVEAMALRNCVIVNDTEENLETIGSAGLSYSGKREAPALREVLQMLLDQPVLVEDYRKKAIERVEQHYNWDQVTDAYEALFCHLVSGNSQTEGK
jgi:glycosyltransferase involved in cell wall biosynthesis